MASTNINIQGQTLEVIVVGGTKLNNAAIVGKQDPFVELSYGNSVYRTNPCEVSGTNPAFHDKFMVELIEGLLHIKISVYNLNNSRKDDFIGKGKVSLSEVIRKGCHDTICYLNNDSWSAGEIRLIMMYPYTLSSYEEMRAAKEKAENDLIFFQNSAPQLVQVTHMEYKLAEQDKELASLRSELIKADKLKKAAESTLKQMQATLDEKDAELITKTQHEAAEVSKRLADSELSLKKMQGEQAAEVDELKKEVEAAKRGFGNTVINYEMAYQNMRVQRAAKDTELDAIKKQLNALQSKLESNDAGPSMLLREYEAALKGQEEKKKGLGFLLLTMRNDLKICVSGMAVSEEEKAPMKKIIKELKVYSKILVETSCETLISEIDQIIFDFGQYGSSLEEEDSE